MGVYKRKFSLFCGLLYIDIYCENNVGFYWVYIMYIIFMNEF